jgi:hypothetical protein
MCNTLGALQIGAHLLMRCRSHVPQQLHVGTAQIHQDTRLRRSAADKRYMHCCIGVFCRAQNHEPKPSSPCPPCLLRRPRRCRRRGWWPASAASRRRAPPPAQPPAAPAPQPAPAARSPCSAARHAPDSQDCNGGYFLLLLHLQLSYPPPWLRDLLLLLACLALQSVVQDGEALGLLCCDHCSLSSVPGPRPQPWPVRTLEHDATIKQKR